MRRKPNICDACVRLRKRSGPEAETSLARWIPYCDAFPERVPNEIYLAGFDHRQPFEGDGDVRFELRPGGERALAAYEASIARRQSARATGNAGPGQGG